MDLRAGFDINEPSVTVPWGITEAQLEKLLHQTPPRRVSRAYLTIPVTVLGGLKCMLGFHFRDSAKLSELEFFRTAYPDQRASFDEFQEYFERAFGAPTHTAEGDAGLPHYEWRLPGATIRHYVLDRFGPEEHMRVWCTSERRTQSSK